MSSRHCSTCRIPGMHPQLSASAIREGSVDLSSFRRNEISTRFIFHKSVKVRSRDTISAPLFSKCNSRLACNRLAVTRCIALLVADDCPTTEYTGLAPAGRSTKKTRLWSKVAREEVPWVIQRGQRHVMQRRGRESFRLDDSSSSLFLARIYSSLRNTKILAFFTINLIINAHLYQSIMSYVKINCNFYY